MICLVERKHFIGLACFSKTQVGFKIDHQHFPSLTNWSGEDQGNISLLSPRLPEHSTCFCCVTENVLMYDGVLLWLSRDDSRSLSWRSHPSPLDPSTCSQQQASSQYSPQSLLRHTLHITISYATLSSTSLSTDYPGWGQIVVNYHSNPSSH